MKVLCTPIKRMPSENSQMATFTYITDSFIAVSLFVKESNTYTNLYNSVDTLSVSIEDFNSYIRLKDITVKEAVKLSLRNYHFGYKCKLSDISKDFSNIDDAYLFFGISILSYEDMLNKQDFSMYQCGYSFTNPFATQFFCRFAETQNTQSTLYNWEGSKKLISTAYFFAPCASLPFTSNENTLLLTHPDYFAIESSVSDLSIANIPVEEKWFYKQPRFYFPDISIECAGTVQSNSKTTIVVYAKRKIRDTATYTMHISDQLIDFPIKLYIESSAGYLPVNRKITENGKIEFELYTDHVPVGTVIDLKVNSRNLTRLASKEIKVV